VTASCTATRSSLRSSDAMIRARADQDGGFKQCCLRSGRF